MAGNGKNARKSTKPRKPKNNAGQAPPLPTRAAAEQQLRAQPKRPRNLRNVRNAARQSPTSDYTMCRLNPFHGSGGAMHPSGSGDKLVCVDHRSYCDFSFRDTTSTAVVRILPSGPFQSILHSTTNTSEFLVTNVKGSDTYDLGTTGADFNASWMPLNVMQEYATNSYPSANITIPYGATRCRIISCGFRLIYTGKLSEVSGLISVTNGSLAIVERGQNADDIIVKSPLDATSTTLTANSVDMIEINTSVSPVPVSQETHTARNEVGVSGTLIQANPTLAFTPCYRGGAVLTRKQNPQTSYICTSTGCRSAVGFYDDSWKPVDIAFTGQNNFQTFRLEVVTCVEYAIPPDSDIIHFAKSSPPANPGYLGRLSSAIGTEPNFGGLNHIVESAERLMPKIERGINTVKKLGGMAGKIAAMVI